MQIRSPGGLSFIPSHIIAIEAHSEPADPRLVLHFYGGTKVTIRFYRNVNGTPPDVYAMKQAIEKAM